MSLHHREGYKRLEQTQITVPHAGTAIGNDMEENAKPQKATTRQVLADVYEEINWAYLAKNYFGKSRSWLYHKFTGTNNAAPDDFSDVDRERLKSSLQDIAERIRQAADRI